MSDEIRLDEIVELDETGLSLKHTARGRPLAHTMAPTEADAMLARWLNGAAETPTVPLLPVLEAAIYLARGTLEAAEFTSQGPEAPGPFGHAS